MEVLDCYPPESVEHGAVRVQPDHAVLDSHAVDEGLLVVDEVGVGDPELVGHPVVQGQVEGDPGVGQPLVPPRLLEVHGDGVVLQEDRSNKTSAGCQDPEDLEDQETFTGRAVEIFTSMQQKNGKVYFGPNTRTKAKYFFICWMLSSLADFRRRILGSVTLIDLFHSVKFGSVCTGKLIPS